jgi:ABC-type phosphate/phosphonate transport system ATPase subunit
MADPSGAAGARTTPSVSTPALESSASSGDSAKAAKLIQDVDKMARRIDRKNLSGDDSQRDILAQKLLQGANKALADRDSVAAISLATKASTLFEPLPKLADSVTPPAP